MMPWVQSGMDLGQLTFRSAFRHVALSVLGNIQEMQSASEWVAHPRVQIFNLHTLYADEDKGFAALLRWLVESGHKPLTYTDAVRRIKGGRIDRPFFTVTFDDGIKSAARALPILREYGASACYFVCPGVLNEDRLSERVRFCIERLHTPAQDLLDWPDVDTLLRAGHEIGSHTMSHKDLSSLSGDALAEEIGSSLDHLRSRCGDVKHFAWPYGHFEHFSAAAQKCVVDTGFESCASGYRGCHAAKWERGGLCLLREHIVGYWPWSHVLYFIARSAGNVDSKLKLPEWWLD